MMLYLQYPSGKFREQVLKKKKMEKCYLKQPGSILHREGDGKPQITRYPAIHYPQSTSYCTPQTRLDYLLQIYYLHFITHNITR